MVTNTSAKLILIIRTGGTDSLESKQGLQQLRCDLRWDSSDHMSTCNGRSIAASEDQTPNKSRYWVLQWTPLQPN